MSDPATNENLRTGRGVRGDFEKDQRVGMKKGWQTKNLGEICEIELGKTPARANSAFWDEKRETGNVWLSIADLLNAEENIVVDSKEYVSDKGAAICKLVPKGTLLVSFKLTLGRLAFAGRDVFTNEAIAALTIFNERELSKEFLYYCLTFFDWVKAAENDVKLKGMTLNKAKLKVMPVSFPPLAEQQRIVGLLDEAFEGLATANANAEKNLQNARALFESHLQSVFTQRCPGWVEKKLGDLIQIQNGYAFKSTNYTDVGYFVIRISNVQDGEITLANPRFIKLADKKLERFILNDGDILISLTGNIGRVGIIQEDQLPAVLNQRVARITVKDQSADRDFLYRFLLSRTFRESLQEAGHGAAQQNVSTKEIEDVRLSLPEKKEQRRIVEEFDNFADETHHLARLYEQKLAALEALKKSLLHQAFTGEL